MNKKKLKSCFLAGLIVVALFVFSTVAKAEIKGAGVWLFDEGKGIEVTDSSGNGNDGIILGDCKYVDGKFGKALQFPCDGEGYIEIPDAPNLNFGEAGDFTVEMWIKTSKKVLHEQRLISKRSPGWPGYEITISNPGDGNHIRYYLGNEPGTSSQNYSMGDSITIIPPNQWVHVALVFKRSIGRVFFYFNGTLSDEDIRVGRSKGLTTETPFLIGGAPTRDTGGWIQLDEVRIIGRALSDQEILKNATLSLAMGTNRNRF